MLACIVQSCILITTTTHAPTQHSPQPTIYRVSGTINVMQAGGSISDNVMSYMSFPDLMSFLQKWEGKMQFEEFEVLRLAGWLSFRFLGRTLTPYSSCISEYIVRIPWCDVNCTL